jgi:type VI secretion system protein ImpC
MSDALQPDVSTATRPKSLLERIIEKGEMVPADNADDKNEQKAATAAADMLHVFSNEYDSMTKAEDWLAMIQAQIAKLDNQIGKQLDEILHNDHFQKLEASWRGLHYFVTNTETSSRLKIRVMSATQDELFKDLDQAIEFDQSALFKKVYEEEYGTFGGYPFSLLIGDYAFGRHPQDIAFLEKMSGVAAAAHAPFIASADAKLFDMNDFTELANPRDLTKIFESTELIKWRSFRESEDSRYVSLALPRILMRLPYGSQTVPVDGFSYEESVDDESLKDEMQPWYKQYSKQVAEAEEGKRIVNKPADRKQYIVKPDHKKYLWGNAAWALGQRITNAFSLYGWCAAIRGVEGGGMVRGLPAHTFKTDEGEIALKCPTEIAITDRREKELDTLGFISLCHCKGTDYAAFFGGQTTQKAKTYDTDAANANARISARLPYLLAASRFAHYLKVMCRDKVGSFQTKETLTTFLNRWISAYVLGADDAGQDLKAQFPLREARIDVVDVKGKPGAYSAVAFLRPHFQLEELTASIRLVAELPPPAA